MAPADTPIAEPSPPAPRRDGLLLALAFAALYLLLGQNSLHNYDLLAILRQIDRGETRHFQHVLYVPLASAWRDLLALFGIPAYAAYRTLASLGAVLGVLLVHRAASALGAGRQRSFYTAALAGALPAVMNSATLAEIDGLFFGVAALAWYCWARWMRHGRPVAAALCGLACGLAAATHAAGHLLVPAMAVTALGWRWRAGRRPVLVAACGLLGLSHLVAFFVLVWLFGGAGMQREMAANTLGGEPALELVPRVLGQEWLLPFFPASVLAPLALLRPRWREPAAALLLATLGYLAVTVAIFSHLRETAAWTPQGELLERGAFLLGIAFPTALLTVAVLHGHWRPLAVAVALGAGVATVRVNDWQRDLPEFAAGLHRVLEREPAEVLVEGVEELASVWKRYPQAPVVPVHALAAELAGHPEAGYEHVKLWFDLRVEQLRARGRSLLITERALHWLAECGREPLMRAAREYLPDRFRMQPVIDGAFRAFRL